MTAQDNQQKHTYRSTAVKNGGGSGMGALWATIIFGAVFLLAGIGSWLLMTLGTLAEAVIDWQQLLFALVFLLLFGGAGGGIIFWSLAQRDKGVLNPKAITQRLAQGIASNEKSQHKLFYFFGSPFVLLSLPAIVNAVSTGQWQGLIALLFTLVGMIVLLVGRAKKRAYQRIGATPLTLSVPLPCIGESVAVRFYLPATLARAPQTLALRLNCQHTYSSGSGDNRTTHTDVLWQHKTQAYIEQTDDGRYDIRGQFALPDDLPVTDAKKYQGSISWELQCQGQLLFVGAHGNEQHEFKRHWQLPVYSREDAKALGEIYSALIRSEPINSKPLSSEAPTEMQADIENTAFAVPQAHQLQQAEISHQQAKASAQQQIATQPDSSGERLYMLSDSQRLKSSGWMGTVFGSVFAAVGVFLLHRATLEGGMLWLMAIIFSGVGGVIVTISVFLLGRKLEMWFDASQSGLAEIEVVRSLFGRQLYRRHGQIVAAEQLILKRTLSSQDQSGELSEYFAVQAQLKDKTLTLVEGIEGRQAAEHVLGRLFEATRQALVGKPQSASKMSMDQNLDKELGI